MSRMRSMQRAFRVVSLLALIGLLLAPRSLVLCVGDSGHVAIESAVELTPCQPVSDDPRLPSKPADDCDDAPLLSDVVKSSVGLEIVALTHAVLASAAQAAAYARPMAMSELVQPTSPPWLRFHRTIVLLV